MKGRSIKIVIAVLLSSTAGLFWFVARSDDALPSAQATAGAPALALAQALSAPAAAISFTTGLEHLPQSLQGTEAPPGLIIDENGNLVVTHALRDFYDYFLSALGEESLATIRARAKAYMHKSLPARAYARADHVFDSYLAYRQNLTSTSQSSTLAGKLDLDALQQQRDTERALRSQYFEQDVVAAFFGSDDAYDNYSIARLKVQGDTRLSDAEKLRQTQALFAQLPADQQVSMKVMEQTLSLEQINTDCKKSHCAPDQLHSLRENVVGPEAADRLQALDDRRAAWNTRVSNYAQQRASILGMQGLSDQDKQAQIQQLQQQDFSVQERLRLAAFEGTIEGAAKK
jgi:lipase chaperone LimK